MGGTTLLTSLALVGQTLSGAQPCHPSTIPPPLASIARIYTSQSQYSPHYKTVHIVLESDKVETPSFEKYPWNLINLEMVPSAGPVLETYSKKFYSPPLTAISRYDYADFTFTPVRPGEDYRIVLSIRSVDPCSGFRVSKNVIDHVSVPAPPDLHKDGPHS